MNNDTTHRALRDYQAAANALARAIANEFPLGDAVFVQLIPGVNSLCEVADHPTPVGYGSRHSSPAAIAPDHLLVRHLTTGAEHRVWIGKVERVSEPMEESA